MDEIITERSGSILRVELNRPTKKNAMTSSMYVVLSDVLNGAAADESVRVVLWHGAGDAFCAGNDLEDFLKNPPGPGESPQVRLINALTYGTIPIHLKGNATAGPASGIRLALERRRMPSTFSAHRVCSLPIG
jgi:enoyl-CoA hydratase/carnithine racemase